VNGDRDGSRVKKKFQCEMMNRPDVDNCVKFVIDSPMEGVIYKEDSCIVKAVIEKHWDSQGECRGRMKLVCLAQTIDITTEVNEDDIV